MTYIRGHRIDRYLTETGSKLVSVDTWGERTILSADRSRTFIEKLLPSLPNSFCTYGS